MKYALVKRGLDFTAALMIALCIWPLFLIVALFVYLEDRGPALYVQTRAGKKHSPFVIYKFRSMKTGTPMLSTEQMQQLGIEPYTKVGKFLRRTSLDELPQLWNIVKGEMSFVGPRPALMTQQCVLDGRAAHEADQLLPGITGLAQVKGRDNLSDEEKVKWDYQYLQQFGFRQDWQILLATLRTVFLNTGNK